MSIQTKLINVTSFAVVLASTFAGSKCTEFLFLTKYNEKFITNINSISSHAKLKWNRANESLKTQISQLKDSIKSIENSENERIQSKLDSERKLLHEVYENATEKKKIELDDELKHFQIEVEGKLEYVGANLYKVESQLKDHLIGKEKHKELERISQMIIEDKIGQFSNCFSLRTLREEYKSLVPIVRQYYLLNDHKISTLNYFLSKNISHMMFTDSPMRRHDVLQELNYVIERGDLHRSLYLFNNLSGWPRLILKDWAEKCRQRLEFIQEIKCQLYLNKI